MEWMYTGPQEEQQSAEDYLLGKVYKPKTNQSGNSVAIPLQGKSKDDWMNKVNTKNDSFTRIHEDPLLIIRQNEKKMREKILSNPYKLAKIKNDLENQLKESDTHKKDKKEKKEKKEKKSKSHRHDGHDNDHDDNDYYHKTKDYKAGNNESVFRERSTYRYDDIKRSDSRDRSYRNYDKSSYRSRSRSPRYQRERSRSRNRSRSPIRKEISNRNHENNSDNESNNTPISEKKYGLIKGEITNKSSNYLGPNPELLRKKLEDEKLKKEELRRRGEKSNISIDDKERKLKEMEENARLAEEMRLKRLNHSSKEDNSNNIKPTNAQFLNTMRSEVYTSNNTDIGERLLQNKYNSQRSIDIETKSGFHR